MSGEVKLIQNMDGYAMLATVCVCVCVCVCVRVSVRMYVCIIMYDVERALTCADLWFGRRLNGRGSVLGCVYAFGTSDIWDEQFVVCRWLNVIIVW